jgi:hypothetical protein
MSDLFHWHPHEIKAKGPVKVHDQLPLDHSKFIIRFNARLALFLTKIVGTMWCAYIFAIFDLLALPTALHQGLYGIVQWVASFFLQLVLLSVIMVGQNIQALAADKRSEQTYKDVETLINGHNEIQQHLDAQDAEIKRISSKEAS